MMFSVFMIIYFVREQEKMKYQAHIEEKKKDLDMDMIIRENTKKMEKQLELLQKSDVDPRNFDSFSEATIENR
jgi:hypothetical protein